MDSLTEMERAEIARTLNLKLEMLHDMCWMGSGKNALWSFVRARKIPTRFLDQSQGAVGLTA